MKRIGWGILIYMVGYSLGRMSGQDQCAKAVARLLPPDASVSRLIHPASRRSNAWN